MTLRAPSIVSTNVLVWFFHWLVVEEPSRLPAARVLVPTHFVFSFTVFLMLDDWYCDAQALLRAIAVLLALALPLAGTLVVNHHRKKRRRRGQGEDGQVP